MAVPRMPVHNAAPARPRRLVAAALILASLLGAAGCGSAAAQSSLSDPPLRVSFYADGTTARVNPSKRCSDDLSNCELSGTTQARLPVPPGTPVQLSMDPEAAQAPWRVTFQYRTPDGQVTRARSEQYAAGARLSYTLRLPQPQDQLLGVEVQQIGSRPVVTADGEVSFLAQRVWQLAVIR